MMQWDFYNVYCLISVLDVVSATGVRTRTAAGVWAFWWFALAAAVMKQMQKKKNSLMELVDQFDYNYLFDLRSRWWRLIDLERLFSLFDSRESRERRDRERERPIGGNNDKNIRKIRKLPSDSDSCSFRYKFQSKSVLVFYISIMSDSIVLCIKMYMNG